MQYLMIILLQNALIATLAGLLAYVVSQWWKSPRIFHLVWLIVLLKMVTPPLVTIEVPDLALVKQTQSPKTTSDHLEQDQFSAPSDLVPDEEQIQKLHEGALINLFSDLDLISEATGTPLEEGPFSVIELSEELQEQALIESPEEVFAPQDAIQQGTMFPEEFLLAPHQIDPIPPRGDRETEPAPLLKEPVEENKLSPTTADTKSQIGESSRLQLVWNWIPILWIGATLSWGLVALARLIQFHRILVRAIQPSQELQERLEDWAQRMGIRNPPKAYITHANISPLLWGSRAIVIPEKILRTLSSRQIGSLLVHELAHYRRRDFLVRWLEGIVLAVFWWYPPTWWILRNLRETEEQCCDEWVVTTIPESRHDYAEALFQTLEFLAVRKPLVLPAGVSPFGQLGFFKRRLEMILTRTQQHQKQGWNKALAVLVLGLGLVPWSFGWAQGTAEPVTEPVTPPTPSVPDLPMTTPPVTNPLNPPVENLPNPGTATDPMLVAPPGSPTPVDPFSPSDVLTSAPTQAAPGSFDPHPMVQPPSKVDAVGPFTPKVSSVPPLEVASPAPKQSVEERLDRLEKLIELLVRTQQGSMKGQPVPVVRAMARKSKGDPRVEIEKANQAVLAVRFKQEIAEVDAQIAEVKKMLETLTLKREKMIEDAKTRLKEDPAPAKEGVLKVNILHNGKSIKEYDFESTEDILKVLPKQIHPDAEIQIEASADTEFDKIRDLLNGLKKLGYSNYSLRLAN